MTPVTCPACGAHVELALEFALELPPTGGDFEFVDSRETHACPSCAARLELSVRAYLGPRDGEVTGIVRLPPAPHPRAPRELQFSPDGRHLAVSAAAGPWLLDTASGRPTPLDPLTPAGVRLLPRCPRLAWSQDGRLLLGDGRVVNERGQPLARVSWSRSALVGLGWRHDQIACAWRELVTNSGTGRSDGRPRHEWIGGVDLFEGTKVARSHPWPMGDGFVMSGVVRFAAAGVYRLAPRRHGASRWIRQRWALDREALRAETHGEGREIEAFAIGGEGPVGVFAEPGPDGWQRWLAWMNDDLAVRAWIPAPGDHGQGRALSLAAAGPTRVIIASGDDVAVARRDGEGGLVERQLRVPGLRCLAARDGTYALATDTQLIVVRGDDTEAFTLETLLPAP